MTTIRLSTNNVQFIQLFENLATALNVSFEKKERGIKPTKSMLSALEQEKKGEIVKLFNHKNAVAEILG